MTKEQRTIRWGHGALQLEIVLDDGSPRLTHLGLPGEAEKPAGASLPLVEVTATGHGRGWSGDRLMGTDLGGRLRHRSHHVTRDGDWHTLTVHLHDPETGLVAEVTYRSPDGIPVLRSEVTLRNEGQSTLHLESISSLVVGCLTPQDPAAIDATDLLWAENGWITECRWQRQPMRVTTPVHQRTREQRARQRRPRPERTGHLVQLRTAAHGRPDGPAYRPYVGVADRAQRRRLALGDAASTDTAAYLALFGPTDTDHSWRHSAGTRRGVPHRTRRARLQRRGGPDAAFAALTRYRRALRRAARRPPGPAGHLQRLHEHA